MMLGLAVGGAAIRMRGRLDAGEYEPCSGFALPQVGLAYPPDWPDRGRDRQACLLPVAPH